MPIDNKNRIPFLESVMLGDHDVYVCHWPGLRLMPELARYDWFHVIADECHNLQNRKAKQTTYLKEIPTLFKTGLSGTPAFDKPDDLWSVLNWLYPTFWTSYWAYFDRYVKWVDYNGYKTIVGVENEQELQMQMRGFYVRRKKEEVIHDLPDVYYTKDVVDLTPKQRRAYTAMKNDMIAWIGENEDKPVNANVVIAQLTRLQQFACAHAEFETINKHKRVNLTNYDKIESYLESGLTIDKRGYIFHTDGSPYTVDLEEMRLADPSSKLDAVMDRIDSTDKQIVIFSQFSQMIELLCKRLEKRNITYGKYIGATKNSERTQIIEDFIKGKIRIFAGTLGAGGTGLDGLQVADTLIFTDRSWSQSLNKQAIGRLHRIGQKNAVHVIDVIAGGTIDVKRMEQIEMQWGWILQLLGETDD